MSIRVHIQRLVLEGFNLAAGQSFRVEDAMKAELSQLFGRGGISPELQLGVAMPSLRPCEVSLSREMKPALLGRQIARAVYTRIGT